MNMEEGSGPRFNAIESINLSYTKITYSYIPVVGDTQKSVTAYYKSETGAWLQKNFVAPELPGL